MTSKPKVKGVEFEFANGEKMIVPPLNLGAIELLQDRLGKFNGTMNSESIALVIDATLMALQRNYPEVTREQVSTDLLDLGNMEEVMGLVMDVSGLKRKEIEKGEAKPRK
jgi:hypothetical protein